jgi:hypothetical protein
MDIERILIPKIEDNRGNLSVIENDVLPFEFKEYTIYMMFQLVLSVAGILI